MGHMRQMWVQMDLHKNCKKLQKIELFFEKVAIYAYFEQFMPKSWHITGRYAGAQKLTFFSISGHFCIEFVLWRAQNMGHMAG